MAQKENIEEIIGMRLQNVFSKEVVTIVSNKYLPKDGQVRLSLAYARLTNHKRDWNLMKAEEVAKTSPEPVVIEKPIEEVAPVVEVEPLPDVVINTGVEAKEVEEKEETPKPAKKSRAKKAKKK